MAQLCAGSHSGSGMWGRLGGEELVSQPENCLGQQVMKPVSDCSTWQKHLLSTHPTTRLRAVL